MLTIRAETPQGLRALIDHLIPYLLQSKGSIKWAESTTVSIVGMGKEKKIIADARLAFTIDGLLIRTFSRVKRWILFVQKQVL